MWPQHFQFNVGYHLINKLILILRFVGHKKQTADLKCITKSQNLKWTHHPRVYIWTTAILHPWDEKGKTALIQLTRINGLPSRSRHLERHCINTHTTHSVHMENAEAGPSLIMDNGAWFRLSIWYEYLSLICVEVVCCQSRTEKHRCVLVMLPECDITCFIGILTTKDVLMSTLHIIQKNKWCTKFIMTSKSWLSEKVSNISLALFS